MIPARYKPKHEPNCDCAVCTTAEFVETMHARNDAREKRMHEILNNPLAIVVHPAIGKRFAWKRAHPSFLCMKTLNRTAAHDRQTP